MAKTTTRRYVPGFELPARPYRPTSKYTRCGTARHCLRCDSLIPIREQRDYCEYRDDCDYVLEQRAAR